MNKAAVAKVEEPQGTELTAASPITPMEMLNMAVEQGADLDKLEKLMDMQERWEANNARKAFAQAKVKFLEICPPIEKTREGHNSNYAGLAESIDKVKDAMIVCEFSHSWKTEQPEPGLIKVTCVLTHVLGHSEDTTLQGAPDDSGNKNSIQAIGSTVSYLERYSLFAALGLASKDQDNDGHLAVFIDEEQKAEIIKYIKDAKADTSKWLKYMKAESVDEILARDYEKAIYSLRMKKLDAEESE
jgi:hypothetical protein